MSMVVILIYWCWCPYILYTSFSILNCQSKISLTSGPPSSLRFKLVIEWPLTILEFNTDQVGLPYKGVQWFKKLRRTFPSLCWQYIVLKAQLVRQWCTPTCHLPFYHLICSALDHLSILASAPTTFVKTASHLSTYHLICLFIFAQPFVGCSIQLQLVNHCNALHAKEQQYNSSQTSVPLSGRMHLPANFAACDLYNMKILGQLLSSFHKITNQTISVHNSRQMQNVIAKRGKKWVEVDGCMRSVHNLEVWPGQRHHHLSNVMRGVLFWRAAVSNDGCHHLHRLAPHLVTADTQNRAVGGFVWRKKCSGKLQKRTFFLKTVNASEGWNLWW